MRPDLTARKQHYLGQQYVVVKEPIGLNYFRFLEEEYAILEMLDGETSLDEVKERFEAEFPPQKITVEEIQQFLGTLHQSGLVVADLPGQGPQLKRRGEKKRRKELIGAASNILAVRFKGFDPERLFNWLYPWVSWAFSPIIFFLSIFFCISAGLLVMVQFDVFAARLPTFESFFSPSNAWLLVLVMGGTKVIHEFGHGLVCKHFGGECHEMGVMFLVLTPCLYCNVSDSWMLRNKWHRVAIGAAGMYVEFVLASVATYIWWFTDSSTVVNNLCLNIMFLSSVSTLLFNINPLLRFDGYYILSDITEIPNLRQKASQILNRKLGQWFLGLEPPEDPFLPQSNQAFFALYSVAAAIYRWVITASILYFLHTLFKSYNLQVLGQIIMAMSLYSLLVMPLYKMFKFFYVPGRLEKVKKKRAYGSLALILALLAGILWIPFPFNVKCAFTTSVEDARTVAVQMPGTIEEVLVKPGQSVKRGELIARLASFEADTDLISAERLMKESDKNYRLTERVAAGNANDQRAKQDLKRAWEDYQGNLRNYEEKKQDYHTKLNLVAPLDGKVIPPELTPKEPMRDGILPGWYGSPFAERNLGATLQKGTIFCEVGNPEKIKVTLLVPQGDVHLVQEGQEVSLKFDELPFETFTGTISAIAPRNQRRVSERTSNRTGGEAATKQGESGEEEYQEALYPAIVILDNPNGMLHSGLRGRAKVHTPWRSLGFQLWRLICAIFNFKL